ATGAPIGPEALEAIFPRPLIEQEFWPKPEVDIPGEVLDIYRLWRPTPLYRARRLEKDLDTPARIYYKYEGVSPAGSHKPNTAVAQAFYNKQAGIRRLATETGAGQWGSALALACRLFGLECTVYMVKVSYQQKPYRRMMMNAWGAEVIPSPSDRTASGRAVLAAAPDSPGSLGIAISEAVGQRVAALEQQVRLLQGNNARSAGAAVLPKQAGAESISRIHEEIYRAYDCGMQINELARKFGRGKGEIELILNLRKMMA
ncbi:MAG: pyridoxal-phosphate dependent enzyme, partial [Firmicutes bacterium]|nr:pyridoxal-phosphate dependent enzyme [Bacillota bacterium]